MEQEQIIPTQYKSKIPHMLSYPVGAKAISDALRGVPQFEGLVVNFHFWNQLARHHGTSTPYGVIDAMYSGPSRYFSASRAIEEQSRDLTWTITAHAVPRSLRHEIHVKILAEALPAIRSWLVSNAHTSEREGSHGIRFGFNELKSELICAETTSLLWRTQRADR